MTVGSDGLRTARGLLQAAPLLWRDRLSEALAIAVLVLAPLPFGSVHDSFVAVWCALMAVSLATATTAGLHRSVTVVILGTIAAMAVVVAVVALQIGSRSPADPIWREASGLLGEALGERPSASRFQPLIALGPMLLVTVTLCRFVLLSRDRAGARRVMMLAGYAGLAYALFGVASFIADPTHVLGQQKTAYLTNLTGTFINRNNAATFFGTVSIIWLMLLASAVRRMQAGRIPLRDRLWLLTTGRAPEVIWRFMAFVICLASTAATGSRAGFILTVVVLAFALALYVRPKRGWSRFRLLPVSAAILAGVLLVALVGGSVGSRLRLVGLVDEARAEVYAASFGLLLSRPWLGIGLGNFAAVFPSIRPDTLSIVGVWDRAHNTPLELALEIGIPAFCLVALVWLWLLARLARIAYRGRDSMAIAALATALLATSHSLVDFPLQTPGYAVFFAAMVGMGLARRVPVPEPESTAR